MYIYYVHMDKNNLYLFPPTYIYLRMYLCKNTYGGNRCRPTGHMMKAYASGTVAGNMRKSPAWPQYLAAVEGFVRWMG